MPFQGTIAPQRRICVHDPPYVAAGCNLLFARMAAAQPAAVNNTRFDLDKTRAVLSDLIEKRLRESGAPSISIALVRGDSIVWKRRSATQTSTQRHRQRQTRSTTLRLKAVTATALMQLFEQGKFKLDDPINRYLGTTRSGIASRAKNR